MKTILQEQRRSSVIVALITMVLGAELVVWPDRSVRLLCTLLGAALLICGLVYIIETASVMLQVIYFKLTHGKRLFKMAPIHHHFEKCGWSERRIVYVFCVATASFSALAIPGLR